MKYLIDTHILIWHGENNPALKPETLAILNDPANDILVSHASLWEMSIKVSLGKLQLGYSLRSLESILLLNNFNLLPLDFTHYQTLSNLPFHHNDPFDRMIIAQAESEEIAIITNDDKFKHYSVRIIQ